MGTFMTKSLDVKDSNATGAALKIDGGSGRYLELSGTFVATIGFELSFDGGTTWRELWSKAAADGFFVQEPATHIRAVTSGYSSGTPAALIRETW